MNFIKTIMQLYFIFSVFSYNFIELWKKKTNG